MSLLFCGSPQVACKTTTFDGYMVLTLAIRGLTTLHAPAIFFVQRIPQSFATTHNSANAAVLSFLEQSMSQVVLLLRDRLDTQ